MKAQREEMIQEEIKIEKARENDGETLYNIGWNYRNNTKDNTKAFAWFYKAALENYSNAQFQVGYMYRNSEGVSQNYKLAMEWFQKAASSGDANAQYSIGKIYDNGYGVTKSVDIAIEWYQKAADNNIEEAKAALERLAKQQNTTNEEHKECSGNEEDTTHSTSKALHQNTNKSALNKVYADPNYDFEDNEDRTNDICLDWFS